MKENAFVASWKSKDGVDAVINSEQTTADLQTMMIGLDQKSEQWTSKWRDAQEYFSGYVEVMKEKTARADAEK